MSKGEVIGSGDWWLETIKLKITFDLHNVVVLGTIRQLNHCKIYFVICQ